MTKLTKAVRSASTVASSSTVLFALLVVVSVTLCSPVSSAVSYQASTIETGEGGRQTVLAAFLSTTEVADLVLITIDKKGRRTVSVLPQHAGQYATPESERELSADLVAIDVGRYQGRDAILGFTQSAAFRLDPFTGERTKLADISTIYGSAIKDELPHIDLFTDINNDGMDDLVIPGFDGFQIHTQRADGSFSAPINLRAPPIVELSFNDYPWYQPRQKYIDDMTLDGRNDVSVLIDNQLHVFPQVDNGLFLTVPIRVDTGIDLDFGGMEELSVSMRDMDQSDSLSRALIKLQDLDGDGLTDMLVISVKSKGVFRKQTSYQLYRGIEVNGKLEFTREPVTTIESKGYQFEIEGLDFNNDNQTDMLISAVDIGLGKVLGALVTGAVSIDLNFYQMRKGLYSAKPDLKREIKATFDLRSGDFFFPSVLIADADGDGIDDLLVQEGEDQLNIFLGSGDASLFSKSPTVIDVHMPSDPELVVAADLNRDGKVDLMMRHEPSTGPKKIVLLVSE
ncbi:MAG: hypothetical protein HOF53_10220 [Gammaproteobacteria bacterium]|nr:hypothetical protein [Gammaproteobacteria bacterium]